MRRLLGIFLVALASLGVFTARAETDLSRVPRYLPYEMQSEISINQMRARTRFMGENFDFADVNRDGWPDLVYCNDTYVAARAHSAGGNVTYYQANLPPAYSSLDSWVSAGAVLVCPDLDGDGRQEVLVWGPFVDRSRWWFRRLDLTTGEQRGEFTLPAGREARIGDGWDGNYYVVGVLDVPRKAETVRALIIGCNVGYDKYDRGILAVDPGNGTVLWRYRTGPTPFPHNTRLADLDGDDQAEIIFVGRSPDNLHGEKINGFSDDETRLFVLDRTGALLWTRRLGGSFGNGELSLADMDGNGRPEIITCARTTPEIWGRLAVWDCDGRALAEHEEARQFCNLQTVSRSDRSRPSLLVTDGVGNLLEYDFGNDGLSLRRRATLPGPATISLVADILPEKGTELIVACRDGRILVLDNELEPLATGAASNRCWGSRIRRWQPNPGTSLLVFANVVSPGLILSKAPFAWRRLTPWAVAAGVLAALVGAWLSWRHRPHPNARLVHETRLHLLDNLELSHHGAIAPLKCVRRLSWHLRALQTNLGDTDRIEIRMREAWSECHESALPHLNGILERARLAGVGNGHTGIVAAALTEIEKQLEALARDNFRPAGRATIADRLEVAEQQADAALIRLRAEVTSYFRADVAQVVARVHAANDLALSQARVQFRAGMAAQAGGGGTTDPGPPPAMIGLCDPHELDFVLDNLVGNAITAMDRSPNRELRVTWRATDGMAIIDVTDTGRGLAEENWDRALNSRYSSKPSGGKGLPESRKYLRKYGGNLVVLRSAPGQGSTFRVTLPLN